MISLMLVFTLLGYPLLLAAEATQYNFLLAVASILVWGLACLGWTDN